VIDNQTVQNLITSWWFDYDQGNFDVWPKYFTGDAHFSCRTDSGTAPYEELLRADVHGRDRVIAWQIGHRRGGPYPLRHNGTNVHVCSAGMRESTFRSYIFVTQILDHSVSNVSSGLCLGRVRLEDREAKIAELRIVLDYTDSEVFGMAPRQQPT